MASDSLAILHRLLGRVRLRHLQALITLNDLRSMSQAAKAMNMTQPAMSQLVSELEQVLEANLFLRHSRGVTPTKAAMDILPIARRIMSATEDGAELIASYNRRDSGVVRLGVSIAAESGILNQALPRLGSSHPGLQIQIELLTGQALDSSFTTDEFDIVACRWRPIVPAGWEFVSCLSDTLEVVCSASHPLAKAGAISDEDLQGATWLANHVATVARQHFDAYTQSRNWKQRRELSFISRIPGVVLPLIASGALLSLLPRSIVIPALQKGDLVVLDTGMSLDLPDVGYFWQPASAGRATRLLASSLRQIAKDNEASG